VESTLKQLAVVTVPKVEGVKYLIVICRFTGAIVDRLNLWIEH